MIIKQFLFHFRFLFFSNFFFFFFFFGESKALDSQWLVLMVWCVHFCNHPWLKRWTWSIHGTLRWWGNPGETDPAVMVVLPWRCTISWYFLLFPPQKTKFFKSKLVSFFPIHCTTQFPAATLAQLLSWKFSILPGLILKKNILIGKKKKKKLSAHIELFQLTERCLKAGNAQQYLLAGMVLGLLSKAWQVFPSPLH